MPMHDIDIEATPVTHPQESLMNSKIAIATTLVALLGAGSAFAQEATADQFPQQVSQNSRAEVHAEALAAQRAGIDVSGIWTFNDVKSVRSRDEVRAEAREAQRLGLIGYGEGPTRVATAV
jgi:hypothetical protein